MDDNVDGNVDFQFYVYKVRDMYSRRFPRLFDRKRCRITFKFNCEKITLYDESSMENRTVGKTTSTLVHYISRDTTPADLQAMKTAIEAQLENINCLIQADDIMDRIECNGNISTSSNDFVVPIYYGEIYAPSEEAALLLTGHLWGYGLGCDVATIKALEPKVKVSSDDECAICLDEFPKGCKVISLPCSHAFHEDCIVTWLMKSQSCPYCRFEITKNQRPQISWKDRLRRYLRHLTRCFTP